MLGYDSYNLSDGSVGNWLQTQAVRIIFYSLNSQIRLTSRAWEKKLFSTYGDKTGQWDNETQCQC